jgi:hypothetical protein
VEILLTSEIPVAVPRERWLVFGLLAILLGQLLYGLRTDGMTGDEIVYIGAGYRHLHGDFTINSEQPPLAKVLGAMPLLTLGLTVPQPLPGEDQDGWSYRFVHEANRAAPILPLARAPIVVLTVALAGLIWAWARRLAGPGAGIGALALVTFQPSVLAHGHLITTDLAGAFAVLLASWLLWRYFDRPSVLLAGLVALAVSAALLTRLTAVVLGPVFLALALIELARSRDRGMTARWLLILAAAQVLVVPLVICAGYGFRFPQPFLDGVRFQIAHNKLGHLSYLLGDRGRSGWWYYYLVAFLVKNTPGFLLLVLVAVWATLRRRASGGAALWHLLLPAAAIFVMASAGHIQIGERYILPVYLYLIVWIAAACAPLAASPRGRYLLGALLVAHGVSALSIAPRGYLTYFNFLAGGPDGGYRFLADSNLDWGQDLPRLAAWMRDHGVAHVQLGYFGADDPDRYGIAHEDLPTGHSHHSPHPAAVPFSGTVVVSPNLLLGFLMPPGRNPYEFLLARAPDDRAGVFFVYRLGGGMGR